MDPSEATQGARCAGCNEPVTVSGDKVFAFGEQAVLCYECGVARGGHHDEVHEKWTSPPDVDDLLSLERET